MKKLKKLIMALMLGTTMMGLTGCQFDIHSDTKAELEVRIADNIRYIDTLQANGFVTKEIADHMKKSMTGVTDMLEKILNGKDNEDGTTTESIMDLDRIKKHLKPATTNVYEGPSLSSELSKGSGDRPLGFSKDDIDKVSKIAGVEVWVLKGTEANENISGADSSGSELVKLDEVQNLLNAYINSERRDADFEPLRQYFTPAIEVKQDAEGNYKETGKKVYVELPDVIKKTEPNTTVKRIDKSERNEEGVYPQYSGKYNSGSNHFGKDFLIYGTEEITVTTKEEVYDKDGKPTGEYKYPKSTEIEKSVSASIALMEINEEFMEAINGLDGTGDANYMFHRGDGKGTGAKLILLNYPVSYIESIEKEKKEGEETSDSTGNTYKANLKASDKLYINLKSGNLKIKTSPNNSDKPTFVDVTQEQGYYYLTDINSINYMNKDRHSKTVDDKTRNGASFTLGTSSPLKPDMKFRVSLQPGDEGYSDKNKWGKVGLFKTGSIVLRDYTETVYMPGVVAGEDWVATGRKIRFSRLKGKPNDKWAYFVDNSGEVFENNYMVDVLLTDLISDEETNEKFNRIPNSAEDIGTSDETTDGLVAVDDTKLPNNYVEKIKVGIPYPNSRLASNSTAYSKSGRPVLYGTKVDLNMFSSKLYTSWINSEEAGYSLAWWNDWLKNNGFNYQVSLDGATQFFTGNYGYDHVVDGDIIFNVDTIKKLSQDMKDANTKRTAGLIRTLFIATGTICMFYGLLVIAAWTYDINVPFGPRILTAITFGNWVAVTSTDDEFVDSKKKMVTFSNVLVLGLCISALGVAFTLFDAVELILGLLRALSSIANGIQKLLY